MTGHHKQKEGALPLAVSIGEPAGIGPDLIITAWLKREELGIPCFFVTGDTAVIEARAHALGASLKACAIAEAGEASARFNEALPVLIIDEPCPAVRAGRPEPAAAPFVIKAIEVAAMSALTAKASSVVTCPIAKSVLMGQGFPFAGHTEYLARIADAHAPSPEGPCLPVMLMSSKALNVVPLTHHIALSAVPGALSVPLILRTATIVDAAFRRFFGCQKPRLAVAGLNPHAGEDGAIGREEIEIIAPAIAQLKAEGLYVNGPFPADTLFHAEARRSYDVALAMYHDQALIPFKTLAFEDGVNVTLGLPFIRTSPDHGTAFSLAGSGKASPRSFVNALKLAARMGATARATAEDAP